MGLNIIGGTLVRAAFVSAFALAAAQASAVTVTFDNTVGTWFAGLLTDNNPITNITGSGTANPKARWGTAATANGLSGYDFDAIDPVVTSLTAPGSSPYVKLGTFTHVNFPIFPPSAKSISLKLTTDVTVGANFVGSYDFIFNFLHDETTNSLDPCPYGGANGQGVNINGCADHVEVSYAGTSDSFVIDGYTYTLDILGFTRGGVLATGFTTIENQRNTADLLGRLTLTKGVVPEASSWAMLIAGFGIVGAAARRRRATVVAA